MVFASGNTVTVGVSLETMLGASGISGQRRLDFHPQPRALAGSTFLAFELPVTLLDPSASKSKRSS